MQRSEIISYLYGLLLLIFILVLSSSWCAPYFLVQLGIIKYDFPLGTKLKPAIVLSNISLDGWKVAYLANEEPAPEAKLDIISSQLSALHTEQQPVHSIILNHKSDEKSAWPTQIIRQDNYDTLSTLTTNNKQACRFFIINPKQQAILCYAEEVKVKALSKDLRRLLKKKKHQQQTAPAAVNLTHTGA